MKWQRRRVLSRWMIPDAYADGNPVDKCRTYERMAWIYNHVRSNNPNFLWNIRNLRRPVCTIKPKQ